MPRIFGNSIQNALQRVTASYNIYWATTKKEREKIGEQSRFYYLKAEVESLNNDEEREFLKLLNDYRYFTLYRQRVKENLMIHEKSLSKEITKDIESKINSNLDEYRWGANEVIQDEKYGKMLSRLLKAFLEVENPDYKYYLNSEVDETDIGKITKRAESRMNESMRVLFEHQLEKVRAALQKKIDAKVSSKSLKSALSFGHNYQADFSSKH